MAKGKSKVDAGALLPVNWAAIEAHWRAGIRSLRSIGHEFGVSAPAIGKHFAKMGVERDLKPRIVAAAQDLVHRRVAEARAVLATPAERVVVALHEREIVDANAGVLAHVQISHRQSIARHRQRVERLSAELDAICDTPELYGLVHGVLDNPDEAGLESLRAAVRLVESLPARLAMVKTLAETLRILVGLEREAHGLDTASGSDGRPLVIVKDFTGRGDPDAPVRDES